MTDCWSRSRSECVSENSPLPVATASTLKVRIAPIASLKADSLITVCATRSRIRTWRKIGTSVAGSVEAMVAPSSSATISGMPRMKCAARPVITAVMRTPTVAITTMVIQTCFRTRKRSAAPPSNRM